jgi:hypothetical protein
MFNTYKELSNALNTQLLQAFWAMESYAYLSNLIWMEEWFDLKS